MPDQEQNNKRDQTSVAWLMWKDSSICHGPFFTSHSIVIGHVLQTFNQNGYICQGQLKTQEKEWPWISWIFILWKEFSDIYSHRVVVLTQRTAKTALQDFLLLEFSKKVFLLCKPNSQVSVDWNPLKEISAFLW